MAHTALPGEPPTSRRRVLLAGFAGIIGVLSSTGCTAGPVVRLDTPVKVPTAPPPSAAELARRRIAGGSEALLTALGRLDPATAPGDCGGRLPGWADVHRAHLMVLAESAPLSPLGLPLAGTAAAAAGGAGPPAPDPLLAATALLRAMTGQAVEVATGDAGLATLFMRIAVARGAQDLILRTAAGLSITVAAWPPDAPVDALSALLAAEHAAVDGYTTAAAWAGARREEMWARGYAHEAVRDALTAVLVAVGAPVVPAAPGYALPVDVLPGTPAGADPDTRAITLAIDIETGVARAAMTAIGSMVATTDPVPLAMLRSTVAFVSDVEAARQHWGAAPETLPGS